MRCVLAAMRDQDREAGTDKTYEKYCECLIHIKPAVLRRAIFGAIP
jgi:hypothetical protein